MAIKTEPMDESDSTEAPGAGDAMDTSEGPSGKTDDIKKLLESGLKEPVVSKLDEIFKSGKLSYSELDQRAIDALKEFRSEDAVEVLKQFQESSLDHVSNKSAYLSGIMKTFRQKSKAPGTSTQSSKGPDEEKIKAILERTGYTLDVTTGQRKYGGPPPNWDKPPPPPGSEVFVGKIPKDIYEDELIPLFEQCGTIWDLRLMMDPLTGQTRGFAFVTFTSKEDAQKAVKQLDNYEIKKGKELKVNVSVPNLRLFVGNIPKDKSKEEIFEEFSKLTAGLVDVIIYSSPDDKKKNRGFCFLEYECHKSASLAKRRLGTGRVKVWSCDIIVDWADPQEEPDEETMSKVRVLYARNLTSEITEEKLKELFERHGKVERVKKIKDYAFIHFEDRDCAVKAMEFLDNTDIGGGTKLSVSLAKPPSDKKKKEEMLRNRERRMMQTMQSRALMMGMPMPPVPPMSRGGRGRLPPPPDPRNYDYDYDYYGYGDYQGGYADPYYEDYYGGGGGGYEDYYDYPGYTPVPPPGPPPPLARGRGRGGSDRGRGSLRGARGTWRTSTAASATRSRAATTRGRGTRGTMRGTGMGINAPPWGANQRGNLTGKRKFDGGHQNQGDSKRRFQNKGGSNSAWGTQPLAQQPLRYLEESWYQDSYGSHWA